MFVSLGAPRCRTPPGLSLSTLDKVVASSTLVHFLASHRQKNMPQPLFSFVKERAVSFEGLETLAERAVEALRNRGSGVSGEISVGVEQAFLDLVEKGGQYTNSTDQGLYVMVSTNVENKIVFRGINIGVAARQSGGLSARLREYDRGGLESSRHAPVREMAARTKVGVLLRDDHLVGIFPSLLLRSIALEGPEAILSAIVHGSSETTLCAGQFGSPISTRVFNPYAGGEMKTVMCYCLSPVMHRVSTVSAALLLSWRTPSS